MGLNDSEVLATGQEGSVDLPGKGRLENIGPDKAGLFHLIYRIGGGMVMTSAAMLLLPRFMQPVDMGLASLALGVFAFLLITCEGGFRLYAIRSDLKSNPLLPGNLLLNQIAHVLLTLVILTTIWGAGRLFIPDIWLNIIPLVFVMLLFQPLYFRRQMATVLLEREMNFRRVGRMELVESLFYNISLIVSAMAAFGAWSFVVAHVVRCSVSFVQAQSVPLVLPTVSGRKWLSQELREAYNYGLTLQGAQWVHNFRGMLTGGLVISLAGAPALGLFDRAQMIGNAALGLIQGVSDRFLFAYSSKHYSSNPEKCRKVLARSIRFITWADKLVYLSILFIGMPLLLKFWGVKWAGVASLAPVVVLGAAIFGSLAFPTYPFLSSIGHARFIFKMAVLAFIVTVVAGPVLVMYFGAAGACWLGVLMWSMSFLWIIKAEKVLGRFAWLRHWVLSVVGAIAVYVLVLHFTCGKY